MTTKDEALRKPKLTSEQKLELLDWVSACQSAYHIDNTPGHCFGGLGSNLQENRDALVEYVEHIVAAAPPTQTGSGQLTDEQEEFIETLRGFGRAYPDDLFIPLTEAEVAEHSAIVTRASASMGRHCAKFMAKAADELEAALRTGQQSAPAPLTDAERPDDRASWTHQELKDEIAKLESVIELANKNAERWKKRAQAVQSEDARDAARYRRLRNSGQIAASRAHSGCICLPMWTTTEADRVALDAAIDAANQGSGK